MGVGRAVENGVGNHSGVADDLQHRPEHAAGAGALLAVEPTGDLKAHAAQGDVRITAQHALEEGVPPFSRIVQIAAPDRDIADHPDGSQRRDVLGEQLAPSTEQGVDEEADKKQHRQVPGYARCREQREAHHLQVEQLRQRKQQVVGQLLDRPGADHRKSIARQHRQQHIRKDAQQLALQHIQISVKQVPALIAARLERQQVT